MRAAVYIDASAEFASPSCIVQTYASVKRHPVIDVTAVAYRAVGIASGKISAALLILYRIHALRRNPALGHPAGNTGRTQYTDSVHIYIDILLTHIYLNITCTVIRFFVLCGSPLPNRLD